MTKIDGRTGIEAHHLRGQIAFVEENQLSGSIVRG